MEMENKVKLTMLGIPVVDTKEVKIDDMTSFFVDSRIPYEKVFELVQSIVNVLVTEAPFVSPLMETVIEDMVLAKYYTNLEIPIFEKDTMSLEEIYGAYDLLAPHMNNIRDKIDKVQLSFIQNTLRRTLDEVTKYRNSAQGVIETLSDSAKENGQSIQDALDVLDNSENADKLGHLVEVINKI